MPLAGPEGLPWSVYVLDDPQRTAPTSQLIIPTNSVYILLGYIARPTGSYFLTPYPYRFFFHSSNEEAIIQFLFIITWAKKYASLSRGAWGAARGGAGDARGRC